MWHFSNYDKKLLYGDGRTIKAGETLTVPGPVSLCYHGLHACKDLLDALNYAPGFYLWKVDLSGEFVNGDDKSAATSRKALWGFNARHVLLAFARQIVLNGVRKHWKAGFPTIALEFLKTGKTDNLDEVVKALRTLWSAYRLSESLTLRQADTAYAAYVAAKAHYDTGESISRIHQAAMELYYAGSRPRKGKDRIKARQNALLTKMVLAEARRRKQKGTNS